MPAKSVNHSAKSTRRKGISSQRKKGRKHLLTVIPLASLTRMINYIRNGAYDWVAAQAVGIDPATFQRWMKDGGLETAEAPIRQFYASVCEAKASARITAEVEVKRDNPQFWLRCGPGKTKPNQPGWTDERNLYDPVGNSLLGGDVSAGYLSSESAGSDQQVTIIQNQQILVMGDALKILDDLGLIKPGVNALPTNGQVHEVQPSSNGASHNGEA